MFSRWECHGSHARLLSPHPFTYSSLKENCSIISKTKKRAYVSAHPISPVSDLPSQRMGIVLASEKGGVQLFSLAHHNVYSI